MMKRLALLLFAFTVGLVSTAPAPQDIPRPPICWPNCPPVNSQ
jgi:hypothetical protein